MLLTEVQVLMIRVRKTFARLPSVSAREAQILKIIYRLFLRNICSLTNSDVGKRKIQFFFFILNNVH